MNFTGIKPNAIMLLAENRFNDSKAFYEEHKKEINEGAVLPMKQIVADLSDVFEKLNPDIILDTRRCLSRVRRDTRFTNDKTLYRENLWLMFRHQKNRLPTPAMWFEFCVSGYNYGCGIVSSTPAFMEYWRKQIKADPEPLLAATKKARKAGFEIEPDPYKRSKAAADGICDAALAQWYDQKGAVMIKQVDGTKRLNEPDKLINELRKAYSALGDLYRYMLEITTRYNSEELYSYEED